MPQLVNRKQASLPPRRTREDPPHSPRPPVSDGFETRFVLESDPQLIPVLIDHLENQVQRLERCNLRALTPVKLALHEALTNAILHGNLELSSELRETNEHEYFRLAAERQGQAPYADRRVIVIARVSTEEMSFVIRDEGMGFNVNILPDPTDPENLTRSSGRGILLIRTFMDRVEFNSRGNEITMVRRWPT